MGRRNQRHREKSKNRMFKESQRLLHRRFFICQVIALFLYRITHHRGLMLDNMVTITPRYILWRILEELVPTESIAIQNAA